MNSFSLSLSAFLSLLPLILNAEAVKDREGAVRNDRAAMEADPRWKYNDVEAGFAEARRTGKPVLVVLRCVPCIACSGIDSAVLLKETDLAPLLDQFVCVRLINANALDLSLFQFDYDLSFSTLFFNGDGTVYGRYGSWTHQKNAQDKTTSGYKRTLEAVLDLHRGYPGNKAQLTGKQGVPVRFKTPIDIPTLTGKYRLELDWNGKVVPSCVHCHQIGDAMRNVYRKELQPVPTEWIYSWPAPETIGLTLAEDQTARIAAVAPGSVAAMAGLLPGDEIVTLAGQALVSSADVSWVLHRAPTQGRLDAGIRRDGDQKVVTLSLPESWRSKGDLSQRVGSWSMRGMATGGLLLKEVLEGQRKGLGLPSAGLALRVDFVGQYGKHAAGKKAGFQKDDVIVELDGKSDRLTESQWMAYVLQNKKVGESMLVTVLRGQERLKLQLPSQ
jgi:serine protease Do